MTECVYILHHADSNLPLLETIRPSCGSRREAARTNTKENFIRVSKTWPALEAMGGTYFNSLYLSLSFLIT